MDIMDKKCISLSNMQPPKTFQIHHPSGKLYDAFRKFSRAHPEASFFQSDAHFRFATQWPEAEAVLFVAVKGQKLQDPGIRYHPNGRPGQPWQPMKEAGAGGQSRPGSKQHGSPEDPLQNKPGTKEQGKARTGAQSEPEEETVVAGSLLAMIIREPTLQSPWWRPFRGLHHKFTARTIIFGGPLLAKGSRLEKEFVLKTLLHAVQEYVKKRSLFTEFRNLYDLGDYKPIFRENNFEWEEWLNLLIDTRSREAAWANMSENRRRQVKKSLFAGAEIVYDPSPEQIDAFYEILTGLYAKKVRKPLPSKSFFHALAREAGPSNDNGLSPIILIVHNQRVIAGIACPILPGKAMYEWYVCGLDKAYNEQDIYPSTMVTWAAIAHAADHNIPMFNFLGMGKPSQEYGVRDFKERFGGQQVRHGRFFAVNHRFRYALAKMAYDIKYGKK